MFTRRTRHSVYKKALAMIEGNEYECICLAIDWITEFTWKDYSDYWPEFAKQKPPNRSHKHAWFERNKEGQQKRIAILKKCIEETAAQNKITK